MTTEEQVKRLTDACAVMMTALQMIAGRLNADAVSVIGARQAIADAAAILTAPANDQPPPTPGGPIPCAPR